MDLTNGGLYFTTDRSASPQTEMLSHLLSVQARTEQGVQQIQKKKKRMIVANLNIFTLWDFSPRAQVRWVSDETAHTVRDIKMSYCKRHQENVVWRKAATASLVLLLGGHVSHQVTDAVAVSELVVVPGRGPKIKKGISRNLREFRRVNVKWIGSLRIAPWDQLDKVVVEGDASASIKDGGVTVSVEVCGDDLQEDQREHSPSLKRGRGQEKQNKTKQLKHQSGRATCLVICVCQKAFHGSFSCSLHNLLDVIVFGLLWRSGVGGDLVHRHKHHTKSYI